MLHNQVCRGLVLAVMFCTASPCVADDWPQWLGPLRKPEWNETGIVEEFPTDGPTLRWEAKIGGGYSGPAVADGRVFVMDRPVESAPENDGALLHDGEAPRNQNFVRRRFAGKERVLCLNEADGRLLWERSYDCAYTTVAIYAIGPRCTPTVDGNRVYTLGAEGHLHCLNAVSGNTVWKRNLQREYSLTIPEWGLASHPLVDGDRLICMVGGADATVVAFDKLTGAEVWRSGSAKQPGYCPPVIYRFGPNRILVVWDSDAVRGLDPKTGAEIWAVDFPPTYAMSIGAPQRDGNRLFVMAFNRRSAMIKLAEDGRSAELMWEGGGNRGIGGVLNTAVVHEGFVYAAGQGGRYHCVNLDTGQRVWSTFEPSPGDRPLNWGNVFTIRAGDRYFHANDVGELIISSMSPSGYKEIDRAQLIEPTHEVGGRTLVWSHPAFANRSIYLRNDKVIRCYSLEATDGH